MSKMLSKMNLISVVQQLPKEDIETIQGYVEMIEEENEELKKKLEERTKMYQNAYKYGQRMEDVAITLKAEQKEFIKYLENKINKLKEQIKNYDIWHEVGTDINFLILKKQFYLEILQNYKEIIGDINNGNKLLRSKEKTYNK